jgi:DNA-binding NarL/FixJ family response regulator
MNDKLNVILGKQNYFIEQGLIKSLEEFPIQEINITQASCDRDLLFLSNTNKIDLIVTSAKGNRESQKSSVEVMSEVRRRGINTPFLFLSDCRSEEVLRQAYKLGNTGVVHFECGKEEFNKALNTILKGYDYYAHEAASLIMGNGSRHIESDELVLLSRREKEVLELIAKEMSTAEIADQLNLSVRTIEGHKSKIKTKFNTKTMIGVIQLAYKHGLLV